MRDVDQALDELGASTGITGMRFDANGNLTLKFDDALSVNIARIDERSIELWSPLDNLGSPGDARLLAFLLAANHLGEGTGAARIALQPHGGGFVLCERVCVTELDAAALNERLGGFARHAMFWNSPDCRAAAGNQEGDSGSMAADIDNMLRV